MKLNDFAFITNSSDKNHKWAYVAGGLVVYVVNLALWYGIVWVIFRAIKNGLGF